jgi:hypothetical protein
MVPLGTSSPAWDRHDNRTAVRMPHEAMAAPGAHDGEADSVQRLNDPCSWYRRDGARHKPARYYKSGHVKCQSHLVWWPNLFDQEFKPLGQVGKRGVARCSARQSASAYPRA